MTVLYGINNCDTIKRVRKWLEKHNVNYEFHDYKKAGCDEKLAKSFLKQFELDVVINRRGTTWRKLPESVKDNLNSNSAVRLMTENPSLIKRPILKVNQTWLIGFDETQWLSILEI